MELKDLKSAWDTYSSQEVDKHRLGKESIHELMKNQTKSLVERIDRNLRIGMLVILAFIAYVILDDLYLSKLLIKEPIRYPDWMVPLDVFSNALIVTTYLFFVIRYLLGTIKTYRRMFYLAVVILLINMVVSFAAGLYQGVKLNAETAVGGIGNLTTSKILAILGVGLGILIPFIAITFLLLRWGFNRLYGRYQIRLNETLQELDESGSVE
jgi:hypothetical protein